MANHPSAAKRHRQNDKRNARNTAIRSRTRRAIRVAREALEKGAEDSATLVKEAIARVYRAASKGVIKGNTASRQVSRLMKAAAAK
ncbi:MAG: 30S ribosomal protein S20 [Deltaproteobacteria bacterium]|nr:30S ribosomal protein S20 [Deltaproteobacteria bacterium]